MAARGTPSATIATMSFVATPKRETDPFGHGSSNAPVRPQPATNYFRGRVATKSIAGLRRDRKDATVATPLAPTYK